uniref:Uncharacterized protein n=1 Tax=Anguilla anguilla TaxID=7936 RepID=A0A0E9U354_ANGAN
MMPITRFQKTAILRSKFNGGN